MKLLFDMGNSFTKWAVANEFDIVDQGKIPAGQSVLEILGGGFDPQAINSIAISSVANESSLQALVQELDGHISAPVYIAKVEPSFGSLSNNYANIDQLGVDRWVAAVGAHHRKSDIAKIVVDAGTAVTVDVISARSAFEGGLILPGFQLMHDSLTRNTAGINSNSEEVKSIIGTDTPSCVNAGCLYGLRGAVKHIIEKILVLEEQPTEVLLCGGGAPHIIDVCNEIDSIYLESVTYNPNLIFSGLIALSEFRA